MQLSMNDEQEPGILQAARSVFSMAKKTGNTECLKDIFEFITAVLKQAGFHLKKNSVSDLDAIARDKVVMMDWFNPIGEKTVGPGDLISYADPRGRDTLGLIENYDTETGTGTMYAMDGSTGEVSTIDFAEADIGETGFLRPKMDLFVGNLADFFAGIDDEHDEYRNKQIGPSPAPY